MNCRQCGSQLAETDRFCPSCGAPKDTGIPPLTREPRAHLEGQERITSYGYRYDDPDVWHRANALSRSFKTQAVITLILYFFLWLPGLIANIVFLVEANRLQRLTGEAPQGKGCLVAMLAMFSLAVVLVCMAVAVGGSSGTATGP